jgi:DNA-binding NtrC family response regulator
MWQWVEHSEGEESRSPGAESGAQLSGRILVVDDDPHFLRVLQRMLAAERFTVSATANSCHAVELLRCGNFDLIICDLRMPDCDGLNILHTLRTAGNEIPVIILTAYGEVETYLEAMNAGATEYLNKPINSNELLSVVRDCLRKCNHRPDARTANSPSQ